MADDKYFSRKKDSKAISGEVLTPGDSLQVIHGAQDANLSELSFWKRLTVMRDVADDRADHYKEMAKIVHEYQKRNFRAEMDALLTSKGKDIVARTAENDMAVNERLARLDEKQKEFFEEYIFSFKTKRMVKYNERIKRVENMRSSGEITDEQADEINSQMADLKSDIDDSFVDGIKDIMRKNIQLRDKIINADD